MTVAAPLTVDLAAWPGIALRITEDGTVAASNGRLEGAVGRGVVGEPVAELLDAESSRDKWARLVRGGCPAGQPCELIFVAAEGLGEPVACSLLRAGDGEGFWLVEHPAPPRLDALAREVVEVNAELSTAQRALIIERARLARALAELERSNRALDEFAHVVSHDLKAPLRALRDTTDALLDAATPPAERDARIERARDLASRMRAMIDAALAYARAGRTTDRAEAVDVARLVPDVVAFLAPPADVCIEIADGLPTIQAERVPLEQVLRNLLANAITYRRGDGARVRVSAHDAGTHWELVVADNGPGIPAAQQERIWRLFHTSRPGEGTGLGLALVRRIVETHGGSIRVDSTEGEGAAFHVRWPKRPVQPLPPPAPHARVAP